MAGDSDSRSRQNEQPSSGAADRGERKPTKRRPTGSPSATGATPRVSNQPAKTPRAMRDASQTAGNPRVSREGVQTGATLPASKQASEGARASRQAAGKPRVPREAGQATGGSRVPREASSRARIQETSNPRPARDGAPRSRGPRPDGEARPPRDQQAKHRPERPLKKKRDVAISAGDRPTPGRVHLQSQSSGRKKDRDSNRSRQKVAGGMASRASRGGAKIASFLASKAAKIVLVAIIALGAISLVDFAVNNGRIYAGVHVGTVDLSGKTADEARALIVQQYEEALNAKRVIIFADEEAANTVNVDEQIAQDDAVAEQISVEEARENKLLWTTNAQELGAIVPYDELVNEALEVGRDDGWLFKRLLALVFSYDIEMRANYDDEAVEALAHDIDLTIGSPRSDYTVSIEEGVASVVEGKDGVMVVRDDFYHELNAAFFTDAQPDSSFVAQVEPAKIRTNVKQATDAANVLNDAFARSTSFSFGEDTWLVSPEELGSWVLVEVVENGRGYDISLKLDAAQVKPSVLSHINSDAYGEGARIEFEVVEKEVTVNPLGEVQIPQLDAAAQILDYALFGAYRKTAGLESVEPEGAADVLAATADGVLVVPVTVGPAPESMTLEEAQAVGLVTEISSYTTEFINSESTQNRLHNIRLVSDFINNTVIKAEGGQWSFNDRAGNCNAERGFLDAGAIIEDGYSDAVGGGICQVATTVFNAVYDAGYPVVRRHNHTLYISSYPAGRDAAVSYPDLDLIWENDSDSDVLLVTSYTNTTITVTLLGIDPLYDVYSETGDWEEGTPHGTKTVLDNDLQPGYSYVETAGSDGMRIEVHRSVRGKTGNLLHEETFYSSYQPITEVVVKGPDVKEETDS